METEGEYAVLNSESSEWFLRVIAELSETDNEELISFLTIAVNDFSCSVIEVKIGSIETRSKLECVRDGEKVTQHFLQPSKTSLSTT